MGMYAGYYRISDAELEQLRQLGNGHCWNRRKN